MSDPVANISPELMTDNNLYAHLQSIAKTRPDDLAVAVQKNFCGYYRYQEISFEQLDSYSNTLATALLSYGIQPGMKAVLMVKPSIDFFALTFALFRAGIVPVFVDPGMGVKNLKQCLGEAAPDAFIGIPKAHIARRLFKWGKPSLKYLVTVGCGFWGGIGLKKLIRHYGQSNNTLNVVTDADAMAAILFTSGSTGPPKGVVYSHRMFQAQIEALRNDYGIAAGERDLSTFPLFALFGPALGMASVIPDMNASKPITAKPMNIISAIERYRCSNLFANPALLDLLGCAGVDQRQEPLQLSSLKRVISAGAPATLPSIIRFCRMLNGGAEVINSYGATESLPLSKIGSDELESTAPITDTGGGICVGRPVNNIDIKIIAISEECIENWRDELVLPDGTIGEIVVKGAVVSKAYYQREFATQCAKIKDGGTLRHRMGDLGYIDETGRLWMCGRKGHRVTCASKTYYSIPAERIFNTHRAVKRSALVGVMRSGKMRPLICLELVSEESIERQQLFEELQTLGSKFDQSEGIEHFLIHQRFPVDIRHNAKIFREKLAVWAQQEIDRDG